MKRENKNLFEEMHFDGIEYAQNCLKETETKLNRNKIGIIISLIVPVINVIVMMLAEKYNWGDSMITLWIITACVAYIVGGGLLDAIKMVWKVTMIGWFIIPVFPVDIATAFVAFCTAGVVALFLPIVFILLNRYQLVKDKKAAEEYLACCH